MPTYQGQTDQVLKIKLPSAILNARWGANEVANGGTIMLEVTTQWVADGSEIQVTVKDFEGGTVETLKGKVFAGIHRRQYVVAKANKTGGMYFEAELKAHGLKAVGPKVKVGPPVEIFALEWLNEEGKALKTVSGDQTLTLRAKLKSSAQDLKASIEIFRNLGMGESRITAFGPYPVKDGMCEMHWVFKMPHEAMENLDRQDSKSEPRPKPVWHFTVTALGTTAKSPVLTGEEDLRIIFESKSKGRPKEIELRQADGRKLMVKVENGEAKIEKTVPMTFDYGLEVLKIPPSLSSSSKVSTPGKIRTGQEIKIGTLVLRFNLPRELINEEKSFLLVVSRKFGSVTFDLETNGPRDYWDSIQTIVGDSVNTDFPELWFNSQLLSKERRSDPNLRFSLFFNYSIKIKDKNENRKLVLFDLHSFADIETLCERICIVPKPGAAKNIVADPYPRIRLNGPWQWHKPFGDAPDPTLFLWKLPAIPVLIDTHMHVQSGKCAPLPLVWDKIPTMMSLRPGWKSLQKTKYLPKLGEFVEINILPTDQIGTIALGELQNAFPPEHFTFYLLNPPPQKLLSCLLMDMEFAHWMGYKGIPIYADLNRHVPALVNKYPELKGAVGSPVDPWGLEWFQVPLEWISSLEEWGQQKFLTQKAMKGSSGCLYAFFHYDPRRWRGAAGHSDGWDRPLREIVTGKNYSPDPYIGIKLYTSLGYRPLDEKLQYQNQMYAQCEIHEIPIMNHASPEGMYTHDREHYYDLLSRDSDPKPVTKGKGTPPKFQEDPRVRTKDDKIRWFNRHFVHPDSWKPVASAFPRLKVCLAHFGNSDYFGISGFSKMSKKALSPAVYKGEQYGFFTRGSEIDYGKSNDLITSIVDLIGENNRFFVDISFFILNRENSDSFANMIQWAKIYKPILLERILWGSDWPLVMSAGFKQNIFQSWGKNNYNYLCGIDPELWFRFTFLNPCQFWNLKSIAPNLSKIWKKPFPWIDELPDLPVDFNTDKLQDYFKKIGNQFFKHAP